MCVGWGSQKELGYGIFQALQSQCTPVYIGMSDTVGKLRKYASHSTYLQNICEKIGKFALQVVPFAGKEIEGRGPSYFLTP